MPIYKAFISEEDIQEYLNTQFEGNYHPEVVHMKIKDGILEVEFEME